MKEIRLTNGYHVVKVDDDDYQMLQQWEWSIDTDGQGRKYAVRHASDPEGLLASDTIKIRMHRYIMDVPDTLKDCKKQLGYYLWVVHKDGDGLNNQRSNLVISRCPQKAYEAKQ